MNDDDCTEDAGHPSWILFTWTEHGGLKAAQRCRPQLISAEQTNPNNDEKEQASSVIKTVALGNTISPSRRLMDARLSRNKIRDGENREPQDTRTAIRVCTFGK